MLRHRADQSPNNATFQFIATIHNVDREILVVNSIEDLGVLLFPTWTELIL
jgi:hypothetical protein